MRRAIRLGLVVAACLVTSGCGPDDPGDDRLVIRPGSGDGSLPFFRVLGTDLTRFRGQIGDSTGSRSVDGVIPQDYVLENARDFAAGSFTKITRGRQSITAQLFVGGELRSQQTTNVENGTVTVTAPLDPRS